MVWEFHMLELGKQSELRALEYLEEMGLVLVLQNYRCRMGEIDLIMRDGQYLVFVEVRFRKRNEYGGGIESITYSKQKKIMNTTEHYLTKYRLAEKHPIRFDVISIDGRSGKVTWLKDAFRVDF
jgi:putative endonuclease